ncbi:hypothetical protein LOK49_LG07G00946 [Camellia lanceoleosa]|uniref:Uncharacterized protein n=1 Tax=Camellia lanceoleosa TaxID=1840588 RepID=A0ACC0H4I7_9ERIC|nr:hypothetical protein LOK49_LG07G00946 [Camellia lanceoleosa]
MEDLDLNIVKVFGDCHDLDFGEARQRRSTFMEVVVGGADWGGGGGSRRWLEKKGSRDQFAAGEKGEVIP